MHFTRIVVIYAAFLTCPERSQHQGSGSHVTSTNCLKKTTLNSMRFRLVAASLLARLQNITSGQVDGYNKPSDPCVNLFIRTPQDLRLCIFRCKDTMHHRCILNLNALKSTETWFCFCLLPPSSDVHENCKFTEDQLSHSMRGLHNPK